MRICLITVTLAVSLVHGSSDYSVSPRYNSKACQRNWNNNAYNIFTKRHILQEVFDRGSKRAWKAYIEKNRLCDRPLQSFFERKERRSLVKICNGSGKPLKNVQNNLCISSSNMPFYEVRVNTKDCTITNVPQKKTSLVIVACDKVNNRCRPVHFERYRNQQPDNNARSCSPRH